jgi:transposase
MDVSSETKQELERRARQTRDVHERLRLCVILARSEGMSPESIAQAHRISVQSVYRYLSEYEVETKTRHNLRGGSQSKLSELQTIQLHDHLQKVTYLHVKKIREYVKTEYMVDYSISGMTFWLKENGFIYKQPIKVPGRLSPEKQEVFIEAYGALKANLAKDEEIYFMDAVHPQFQSQAVCGWIKKGEIKTLPTTSDQYRMHFVGAVALKKMEIFAQEYETVNAESVIEFLKNLEVKSKAATIHIICDNGPSNKNEKLREYLKASKIKMHYLPPYSPNLNPIERLWKVLRERKTYNKYYEKFIDFKIAIRGFFTEDIPKIKNELIKRINDDFQCIQLNTIVLAEA